MLNSTHRTAVAQNKITKEDVYRVTLWLDGHSHELGSYNTGKVAAARAGQVVWPEQDCDPKNPTRVESDRPVASGTVDIIGKHWHDIGIASRLQIEAAPGSLRLSNSKDALLALRIFDLEGRLVFRRSVAVGLQPVVVNLDTRKFGGKVWLIAAKSGDEYVSRTFLFR